MANFLNNNRQATAGHRSRLRVGVASHFQPWFSGGLNCTLTTGEVVEVSRRQALRFKELMSL